MSFHSTEQKIGSQPIADTETSQKHPLGTIVRAVDPDKGEGEFIYLSGLASTAVGEVVVYNADDWSTKLAVANDKGPVAVAMSANVASQYGWYQISGKASALAATGFADNGDVFLTATPGTIDDADVAGDLVVGAKGASAVSGGLADLEIHRPRVKDGEED